jgi:hypothetical protein
MPWDVLHNWNTMVKLLVWYFWMKWVSHKGPWTKQNVNVTSSVQLAYQESFDALRHSPWPTVHRVDPAAPLLSAVSYYSRRDALWIRKDLRGAGCNLVQVQNEWNQDILQLVQLISRSRLELRPSRTAVIRDAVPVSAIRCWTCGFSGLQLNMISTNKHLIRAIELQHSWFSWSRLVRYSKAKLKSTRGKTSPWFYTLWIWNVSDKKDFRFSQRRV